MLTAQLVRSFASDSNGALVAVSIVASGLAAAAVYLTARRFAGRGPSAVAALGLGLSPIAWTFGETAVPYEILAFGSPALAGAFHVSRGAPSRTLGASLAFGLLAGFRQDLLIVLGPLWLWMVAPLAWRERAAAAAVVLIACTAWLVPSALGSGGLAGYASALIAQSGRVETMSPLGGGAPQLLQNLALSAYGLFWGTLAVGLLLLVRALAAPRAAMRSGDAVFFALWIVPGLVFYTFVHTGDPAYVLSIVPAIFVLFARWLDSVARARPVALPVALAVVIAQAAFFLIPGPYGLSSAVLAAHDRSIDDLVATTRATSPDASLVAAQSGYLTAAYYVRDRPVRFSGEGPEVLARDARTEPPPRGRTTVIVFGGGVRLDAIVTTKLAPSMESFAVDAGAAYPIPLYDLGVR